MREMIWKKGKSSELKKTLVKTKSSICLSSNKEQNYLLFIWCYDTEEHV